MKNLIILLFLFPLFWSCTNGNDQVADQHDGGMAADSASTDPITVPSDVLGIAVIEPVGRIVQVAAESGGIIREVRVEAGSPVKKGEIIVVLDDDLEAAQLRQANARAATQKESVEVARADAAVLQVQLDKARRDVERNQTLEQGNALTRKELEDSRALLEELEARLAGQKVAVVEQQTRLAELQAEVAYYQTLKDRKRVKAPADGVFLTVDARPGEFLSENTVVGQFAPNGKTMALTEIDELFADKIKVGQRATIRPQGRNEILTGGTVILASPYLRKKSLFTDSANNLEDRRVREVRVELDDPSKVLLGARVECLIYIGGE
ncbi:MAG: efflux RND transporter periplasmic adaptor subunit [Lewinellaceae bacterium]|nr:efflux RND transporter periplasmic adaptor subunit [Lewinellaceae bacterium]